MFGLPLLDLLVIVIYLAGITALGMWTAKRVTGMGDFVMPRRFGKLFMIMHTFGTGTNSDQAISVAAKCSTNGISGIWYTWNSLFSTPFYWILGPIYRRFRAYTIGDVFEARFDRSVSMLYAVAGVMKLTFSIGVALKGASLMLTATSGGAISGDAAILVLTLLFVLYGTAGGLASAIVTDFVQGILTIFYSVLLLPFVWHAAGGVAGIRTALEDPTMFNLVAPEIGLFYIVMLSAVNMMSIVAAPHTMGMCAAGKGEIEGAVGFMVGSFVKRACSIAWALTGLAAVAYLAGRTFHSEEVYGLVAREFLPGIMPGLLGIFLATMMAGLMSTCDSLMIASSALFTENLYRPMRPDCGKKHYLLVARITAVSIVFGGVSIAFWLPGFIAGVEIYWKLSSIIGIAMILGLCWNQTTVAGAWAATLGGFGVWWLTTQGFFLQWLQGFAISETWTIVIMKGGTAVFSLPWQILAYSVAGFSLGVVVSLLTKPVDAEKLESFYALIRTPIQEGEETETPCTLPSGIVPPPKRLLFPGTGVEFIVPSKRTVAGFTAGWVIVAALIALVVGILH